MYLIPTTLLAQTTEVVNFNDRIQSLQESTILPVSQFQSIDTSSWDNISWDNISWNTTTGNTLTNSILPSIIKKLESNKTTNTGTINTWTINKKLSNKNLSNTELLKMREKIESRKLQDISTKKTKNNNSNSLKEYRSGKIIPINNIETDALENTLKKYDAIEWKRWLFFWKKFWKTDKALLLSTWWNLPVDITLVWVDTTGSWNISSSDTSTGNEIQVNLSTDTTFVSENQTDYKGIIAPPTIQSNPEINGYFISKTIEVGNSGETILIKDNNGWTWYATITIPLPELEVDQNITIFSSQDGQTWTHHTNTRIQNINGIPSVQFTTSHFTIFAVGNINWNNSNMLISPTFWSKPLSTSTVIRALYGDGTGSTQTTVYTKFWNSRICNTWSISVVSINPGTDTIGTLNANTIYILNSWNYILDINRISFWWDCTALIGKGNITIYTYEQNIPIVAHGRSNIIIDNITINNINDGVWSTHTANSVGMLLSWTTNSTIHNIKSFSGGYGLQIYYPSTTNSYIYIFDSKFRGNTRAITTYGASVCFVNNNILNNNTYAIYADYNSYISIYNNLFYSNTSNISTATSSYYYNYYNATSNSRWTRQNSYTYSFFYIPYFYYYYWVQPSDYNLNEEVWDREVWTELTWTGTNPELIYTNYFSGSVNIKKRSLQNLSFEFWSSDISTSLANIVDSGLFIMYNFDNVADLWENSTKVLNLSPSSKTQNRP